MSTIAMEQGTDAELVEKALTGDRDAFAALVRRYQDYAYGPAVGVLANLELSQDVVQEAFLRAYRDLSKLKDRARFAGWLRGIVRHTAFRALREMNSVRALAEQFARSGVPMPQTPRPDRAAEQAEAHQIVRSALSRLSAQNREAVSLHYVDGLSYADIAGFLGVTVTAVQGRLQRGRRELRKELAMVAETFKDKALPDDFSTEVKRLLGLAVAGAKGREESIECLAEIGAPAVEPLCEALGDPRIPVRRAAACALCKIGDERALGPILRVLYGDDYWTGNALLRTGRALGVPGVREELLRIARHGQRDHQYWAILALGHAKGDREVFECLNEIFHDTGQYAGTRKCALGALCELRPDLAAELVTEALGDTDIRMSSGHAWWIALKSGLKLPIDVCLGGFGREIAPNSRMMAGRLVLRDAQEGRRALLNVIRTGSRDHRAAAALALSREKDGEAFEILVSELIDGYRERKWARIVSRALIAHYPEKLERWAESRRKDLVDCPEIAWALAKVRLSAGKETPKDVYKCGTPNIRAAVLRKLAVERGVDFLPELRRCLREGRPGKVAREAFRQMYRLGEVAMSTVEQMLESQQWTERKAAYCLLRRWGKLTTEQRKRGEEDSHVAVRHAANWHPELRKAAEWHEKWRRRIGHDSTQAP